VVIAVVRAWHAALIRRWAIAPPGVNRRTARVKGTCGGWAAIVRERQQERFGVLHVGTLRETARGITGEVVTLGDELAGTRALCKLVTGYNRISENCRDGMIQVESVKITV
jgi:hypothetical protein